MVSKLEITNWIDVASIKEADRKRLWGRSGNECAYPNCDRTLIRDPPVADEAHTPTTPVVMGEEAHIVAKEDDGPRGDPSMPISERNAYPNLILLCADHHTLIDSDNGIHFTVEQLHAMKDEHEDLVERRRVGHDDAEETRRIRRRDQLLELASESRGRLVARWVAAGVSAQLAVTLADDDSVGAPARLVQDMSRRGLTVLEGEFGSGKSVTGERIHAADVLAALDDDAAAVPVYLSAQSIGGTLTQSVRSQADGLGDPRKNGIRLVLDGLDESGPARAIELLDEVRSLAATWPDSRVVITARPGLKLDDEERLPYPALSDEEATALAGRLGESHSILWSQSEAVRKMLHLPLFLIVAVLRRHAGVSVPRSQGTFLEALSDAALKRTHYPTDETRARLSRLASLTVGSGGVAVAAELGGDHVVRSVLETRLVVRSGRRLQFALPIIEQYFAAQYVLEAGLADLNLDDLKLLDRWRDALTLAVTVGSWQQTCQLLDALASVHPGFASWLVANAVPAMVAKTDTELPGSLECALRIYHGLSRWSDALGAVSAGLGLTDGEGRVRTVGAFVEGNNITVGLKKGDSGGVSAAVLPYGLHPFTGRAPDGTEWLPFRWGHAPADILAWPWRWSLDWVSAGLQQVLRTKALPLPANTLYQAERQWVVAKSVVRRIGRIDHRPLEVEKLRLAAEELLNSMESRGQLFYKPTRNRLPLIEKAEIADLIRGIDTGNLATSDGMLLRPAPAPDNTHGAGGHISSVYSDEALRRLVEHVYAAAIDIYADLVNAWFSPFAPMLGLACILPVAFRAQLTPQSGPWGDPDFIYEMEPLPPGSPSTSNVLLVASREDFALDWESIVAEGQRLRRLITAFHPGTEGWAYLRSADATLEVYGDMPATSQAYRWLWEDLHRLHMVKDMPPHELIS